MPSSIQQVIRGDAEQIAIWSGNATAEDFGAIGHGSHRSLCAKLIVMAFSKSSAAGWRWRGVLPICA